TLKGEADIHPAKNSAVAIIPAAILAEDKATIEGLPEISDVETLVSLLGDLNIKTELDGMTLKVDPTDIENAPLPNNKV
ncbi:UDP-N-acetylglucosamine 1-carboxyvinyltransferase, partial [Staphylococcus aureus]